MNYYLIKKSELEKLDVDELKPDVYIEYQDGENVLTVTERCADEFIEDVTDFIEDWIDELEGMYKLSMDEIYTKLHSGEFVPDIEGDLLTCDWVEAIRWIELVIDNGGVE